MERAEPQAVSASGETAPWQVVAAGLLALAAAMGVGRFAFTPILPAMRDAFALSPADLGTLASANYLGYLVGAIAAAAVPAVAQGWLLRGSLLLVVLSTVLMATASTMPVWLVLRFVAGLASAGVFVLGSAAVFGWLTRRGRLDLLGWLFSGVGIGIAASGLVILAWQHLSPGDSALWRGEWLAVATLAAALVALCWRWLPWDLEGDAPQEAPRPADAPARGGWSWPIVLLGAAYFLDGAGYIVAGTFLVAIVATVPGLATLGAAAWVLVGLAGAPSAMLFGGTFIGITALTLAEARRRVPPALVPRVIGLLTAVFGLGQVIGPLAAAALAGETGDFRPALLVASGAVLLAALLVVAAGRMPRAPAGAPYRTGHGGAGLGDVARANR